LKTLKITLSKIGLLGIPYNVGSKGLRLEKGAEALRKAGIVNELRKVSEVVDFGNLNINLPIPDYTNPKLLNPNQFETLSRALAEKIKTLINAGYFPLVFGGDCSAAIGIIEALRGYSPRIGMVYMDAHGDFNTPDTSPSGIIGGMDVALIAGKGPKNLSAMFGHSPLIPEENIVLFGVRDLDPLEERALFNSKVKIYRRERIRSQGAENVANEILRSLEPRCESMYLHVDLDVLDSSVFSASGLPVPDGLTKKEFQGAFKILARGGRLCGLTLTAFDAAKDADGNQARNVLDLVVETLCG
jgi:arginase